MNSFSSSAGDLSIHGTIRLTESRMPKDCDEFTCTREEVTVLSMIKAWPDIPAIVTYSREGGWSVSTSAEDVERRRTASAL